MKTIKKFLRKLESNKACGQDNIPYEALKIGFKELAPFILKAFNIILKTGQHIPSWSEGLMYLLYKGKGDPNDLKNYRGITVNNAISKVFWDFHIIGFPDFFLEIGLSPSGLTQP